MTIRELMQKRAKMIADARALLDLAEKENREFTQEEQSQWDRLMTEAGKLATQIEREERQAALEQELQQPAYSAVLRSDGSQGQPERRQQVEFHSRGMQAVDVAELQNEPLWKRLFPFAETGYNQAFQRFLRHGEIQRQALAETRALQADLDVSGGYLITPLQVVDRLVQAIDDQTFIRQWATVLSVPNAESLGVPTLDADPADADWTSELATGSEDSTMAFVRRALTPHPLAKRIKISNKLLMKVPNAEQLVISRLAYKFGITFEKAGMTGTGVGQPLGVFTASANGISTGRDVSTGNTTTAMTFDGLKEAKYTLKGQYWPRARWLFHRDGIKQIAKIKDGNGQYIWAESVRVGEPDRLLGIPVFGSEYAPATFTTGLYVGIIGDFSNYWIADSMAMTMQRLVELYAETNQVGLIGRLESDGMPVLEEAFVRVKLA